MSNSDPSREVAHAIEPVDQSNTLITINSQDNNTPAIVNPVSATATNSETPSNDELNSSIGSQRSLNSRLFPFRFSRDMLLNNVSLYFSLTFRNLLQLMIHFFVLTFESS